MSQQIIQMALLSSKNKVRCKILFTTQLKYYINFNTTFQAPYKGAAYEKSNILQLLTVSFRAIFSFFPISAQLTVYGIKDCIWPV